MIVMLLSLFLVLLCTGASQENMQGTAFVSGAAELKCNFNNPKNISLKLLTLYWQIGNEVVYVLTNGEEEKSRIDEKHKHRTMFLHPNGDLTMYNITFHDRNDYTCHVFSNNIRSKWLDVEHTSTFQLHVIANFSDPEIKCGSVSTLKKFTQGETVNMHCSSGNGFPKPERMFWKVSDENGTKPFYPTNDIIDIRSAFNISSNLTWKVDYNINITCVLLTQHAELYSKALEIEIEKKTRQPDHKDPITPTIIAITTILILAVLSLIIYLNKKHRICKKNVPQAHEGEEMQSLKSEDVNQPVPTKITTENETANGSSPDPSA